MFRFLILNFVVLFLFRPLMSKIHYEIQDKKADLICKKLLNSEDIVYEEYFSKNFIKVVPFSVLQKMMQDWISTIGKCESYQNIEKANESVFYYKFTSSRQRFITLSLSFDAEGLINGLSLKDIGFPDIVINSFKDLEIYIKSENNNMSVSIINFSDSGKSLSYLGNRVGPIGSIFKLYVLGALVDVITSGVYKWSDEIKIKDNFKSLPSGIMQTYPEGTSASLYKFAEHMIKISDNTATDHLIEFLGRSKVESQLRIMKNDAIQKNIPFLKTSELFKLKWAVDEKFISNYFQLSSDKKLQILNEELIEVPLKSVGTNSKPMSRPTYIDTLEWFSSTQSICRGLEVLEEKKSKEVLNVLSQNVPLVESGKPNDFWQYAGFKGGSEPGVLAFSYLLKSKSGSLGCVAIIIKNETNEINQLLSLDILKKILNISESIIN